MLRWQAQLVHLSAEQIQNEELWSPVPVDSSTIQVLQKGLGFTGGKKAERL